MNNDFKKSNFSILFIDDEEKSTKYFKKTFGKDFNIITTNNPKEVLQIIDNNHEEIAVVISDQVMPDSSGVEILSQIKEKKHNIIRILTTAYSSLENNIAAINKSNVYAYLTKPWDLAETKAILIRALEEFQSRKNYLSLGGSIAHEMRNPLNNVRQSTKLVKDKLSDAHKNEISCDIRGGIEKITPLSKGDFKEIIDSLDIADNSVKRGHAIIDIILNNISGRLTDKSHFKYITASVIIDATMTEYSFKDGERESISLSIEPEQDFIFKGDEIPMIYVFLNLLNNSLYYLSSQKNLSINIKSEVGKDGFNRIYFRDSGPGIPKEILNNLFEAFSTSGKEQGTGLGLSFCKKAMKDIRGEISCTSKEGEFTQFILSFPKISETENESCTNSNKNILLVDDQESNLMIAKKLLENKLLSTNCDIAKNGIEALDKIKSSNYDLILMDIEMPEMDGITATKEIRKFDKKTPIIAHSSRTLKSVIEQLTTSGFNGYVSKPSNEITLRMVSKWGIIRLKDSLLDKSITKDFLNEKRILLADDEETNLSLTEKYLNNKFKAKVDKARNGQEAYEMAKNNEYDLLLIDIQMPKMNGLTAIQEIRKFQSENNLELTPSIALTGDNSEMQIHKTLNAGFDDYFIKGDSYDDLSDIAAFWINMKNYKDSSVLISSPEN